ncbi:SMP-30/gluconolactonase/LRE family protein [Streptomyces luteireticuli]|uniref:SMP-30/gluconolactonase/LRE family protein n=1 Tax=Streptomyces luteireticuli TaxID=173858 RepID=UPI0035571B7E
MRLRSLVTTTTLLTTLLVGAQGAATAAETPHCADRAAVTVFRPGGLPVADWRENLEFDGHGTLWVSHLARNRVEGYAPDGTLRTTVPVSGPGGIRRGPDGRMYVNYGINPLARDGGIVAFDPKDAHPRAATVVTGTRGINGLAIDDAGNFYLTRELATGILKIRPDGTRDEEWTRKAAVFGTNGIAVSGGQLYASVLTDLHSSLVRIPLSDPARHTVVTRLSPNPLKAKVLDDLTVLDDGDVVVASFARGELLRVTPSTGRSCLLATGLRMPTSVRAAHGFGGYDARHDLFVTEASGRIVRVRIG